MPLSKFKIPVELFFFWLFPAVSLWFSFTYFRNTVSTAFALYALLLPALTMYIVVATGAGYCKLWYFTVNYSVKGVMVLIGFLYAAVLNPVCILLEPLLIQPNFIFIPVCGLLTAVIGTMVDVLLLGTGLLYVKSRKYPPGSNPVAHALSYGPRFFGLAGIINGAAVYAGYHYTIVPHTNPSLAPVLFLTVITTALPFIIYLLRAKRKMERYKRALAQQ
jgi:hypothetical protein